MDVSTGERDWLFDDIDGTVRSGATVKDDLIYFGTDESVIYAVDIETHEEVWSYDTGAGEVASTPTVAGCRVYLGDNGDRLYSFDATTGDEVWSYSLSSSVGTSPIVVDGVVYASLTSSPR